ncbi:MAG: PRC-barrel domain-containing protein [Acetobacteraceae bacterium]
MARHAIGPMILAASILAVPVLAATTNDAPNNSPAAASSAPGSATGAGMTATHADRTAPATATTADRSATAADNNADATPRYTTSDGQMRIGKIVGASVYNDQKQSIGSVDDVLMGSGNKATTAVLSVGGFLGMGSKLVSVPFDQLRIENDRIVMPGATKASLNGMPEYKFNKNA